MNLTALADMSQPSPCSELARVRTELFQLLIILGCPIVITVFYFTPTPGTERSGVGSKFFHLAMRRGRKIAKVAMARRRAVGLYRMWRHQWREPAGRRA